MTFILPSGRIIFATEIDQMKKHWIYFTVCLLTSFGLGSGYAQDSSYLFMDVQIDADTIVVQVKPTRFESVYHLEFGLGFPKSNIEFVRGTSVPTLPGASIAGNPGNCVFSWSSSPVGAVSLNDNLVFAEFRFHISSPTNLYCFDFNPGIIDLKMRSLRADPTPARGIPNCKSNLKGSVSGLISKDLNMDCLPDNNPVGLGNSLLIFENSQQQKFYAFADQNGAFYLELDPDSYTYFTTGNGLRSYCNTPGNIQITGPGQKINIHQTVQENVDCAEIEVQLTTPGLRWCEDLVLNLNYRNQGTSDAIDAFIVFELDPSLEWIGASLPATPLGNNSYRFNLGNLREDDHGNIRIYAKSPCDPQFLNNSVCNRADAFPKTPCIIHPQYSGAELEISASCIQNEVVFLITNSGTADMTSELAFTTVEDDVMPGIGGGIMLQRQQSREVKLPANGKTWRIVFDTIPFHPYKVRFTKALEGCGSGNHSKGFVDQFSQGDEAPQTSVICSELVNNLNLKSAVPEGFGSDHTIYQDNRIYYSFRFPNRNRDTARILEWIEKLSPYLDPASLKIHNQNAKLEWSLNDQNEIYLRIADLKIPPISTDSDNAYVYLSYSAIPSADAPPRSIIQNQSSFRYDFAIWDNTNSIRHRINQWTISNVNDHSNRNIEFTITPNPFSDRLVFSFQGSEHLHLKIFDPLGICIHSDNQPGTHKIWLPNGTSSVGVYFYQLADEKGRFIQSGKLIRQ